MNHNRILTRGLSWILVLLLMIPIPVLAVEIEGQSVIEEITDSHASVPLYFQTDYPNQRYGSGTVASSGCGITSLAMVASYMTGYDYLPDILAEYFGGRAENNIARMEHASDVLQLPWHQAENFHEILDALREGNLAIIMLNHLSIFTEDQHFIVLTGISEDGRIFVNDPFAPNYEHWQLKNGFRNGFEEGDLLLGYSGGWIYEVNNMPEEPFFYVEERPEVEYTPYSGIELTWEEQQLLAKVIWAEARGESAEGQQAIAEIVFNRMLSENHPDSLHDVIHAEGQFRTVPSWRMRPPGRLSTKPLKMPSGVPTFCPPM